MPHKRLQGNKKIPKWEPRAKVGVYLWQSKEHAYHVSFVLNPKICHISVQCHLIYDDDFSTVNATQNW